MEVGVDLHAAGVIDQVVPLLVEFEPWPPLPLCIEHCIGHPGVILAWVQDITYIVPTLEACSVSSISVRVVIHIATAPGACL